MNDWAFSVAASMLGYDELCDVLVNDMGWVFTLAEGLLGEDE